MLNVQLNNINSVKQTRFQSTLFSLFLFPGFSPRSTCLPCGGSQTLVAVKESALPHRRWGKGTTESFNRRQSDMKSNPPLYFQLLNFKDDPYKAYPSLLARFPNTAVNPFAPKISLVTLLPVCHEILTRLALRVGHQISE